jgi:carbon-monoxide dehydrogenase medium subunit
MRAAHPGTGRSQRDIRVGERDFPTRMRQDHRVKPSPFGYAAPATTDDALAVLAQVGDEAKVLAGGQSLVPILNMRLAAPGYLVDINRIAALSYVRAEDGGVRVGAIARHAEVERSQAAFDVLPLLRQALQLVAHPVIRNRGTTVGSLAHADPSGEMTAVLALTGGTVEIARQGSTRTVSAAEFFLGPLESACTAGELALSAFFPALPAGTGSTFVEVARRHGDYAVCGVAAAVTVDEARAVTAARAAYVSVAPTPLVLDLTSAVEGSAVADADWAAAGELARSQTEPEADIHATADYRSHLVGVLTARALAEAAGRAVA